jgi:hypothetical protein
VQRIPIISSRERRFAILEAIESRHREDALTASPTHSPP